MERDDSYNPQSLYYRLGNHDTIRILTLLQGVKDSLIECHLDSISLTIPRREFSFETKEEYKARVYTLEHVEVHIQTIHAFKAHQFNPPLADYHALSYEWGIAQEDDPTIKVNGIDVKICRNLHDALQEIRQVRGNVRLWVDALCIDQVDSDEKSQQVSMMSGIYASARSVIARLGPAADDSDIAIEFLASVNINSKSKLRRTTFQGEDKRPVCNAVKTLCNRRYWRRIWMVQELHFAREITIRCGTKVLPGKQFWSAYFKVISCGAFKDTRLSPVNVHVRGRSGNDSFTTLNSWLKLTREHDFQSSRPHDFIYALIAVTTDCDASKITVDYAKDIREVFLDVVSLRRRLWKIMRQDIVPLLVRIGIHLDGPFMKRLSGLLNVSMELFSHMSELGALEEIVDERIEITTFRRMGIVDTLDFGPDYHPFDTPQAREQIRMYLRDGRGTAPVNDDSGSSSESDSDAKPSSRERRLLPEV